MIKILSYILTAAVGLALGAVIASGGTSADASKVEPSVVTETKTVTETVEVAAVPQACLDALDEAEQISGIAAEFADTASTFPPLVGDAFEAGINMDNVAAQRIIDQMDASNQEMDDQNSRMRPLVDAFVDDKQACRDAS